MPTIKKTVGQITLKVLTDVESTTYYYLLQSSMAPAPSAPTTNPPGSGWSTTEPEFFSYIPTQDTIVVSGKDYYTRSGSAGSYTYTIVSNPTGNPSTNSYYEKIYGDTRSLYVTVQTLYTDGTYDYTTPSLSSSYEAAKEAYNRAQSALTIAGDINQYFWALSSSYSTDVPAGVYVTNIPQNQFKSAPAQGNILIQSSGITIRNGAIPLASLTGTALNFYNPTTHEANATLSSGGLILSKGGIRVNTVGSNNGVYISSDNLGSSISLDNNVKTNWRAVIGSKFGVDSEGNLYANNAHLSSANVEGAITATSLTIGSGSSAYDGAAAINISGYDIEIEKNGTDEVEDVSVYLYPILYHNGIKVEEYTLSTDTTVNISKDYYTRSGSAGNYTYTIVSNPSGNPSTQLYYEKQINYSHFIWYQDDDTIGTEGDENNKGRYLATYGHNYRVIYDFDDGAVGGGTEVQTRTIDPSKYITKVSDTGITIHPEVWSNQSSYIQLDANGLNLFDSNGNSIAQYGNTARIGLNNSSRFLVNSSSLQAYDNNNNKYFEVNANGLSWGTQTAATTQQVSNLSTIIDGKADISDVPTTVIELSDGADYSTTIQMNTAISGAVNTAVNNLSTPIANAAKTAINYITTIDGGGIKVHDEEDEDNYAKIDATGLEVFNDVDNISTSVAKFGATSRIGELASKTPHIEMNNRFMEINNNEKSYFGAGFVNQSASLIRIPFEAKYCTGTTTLTLTTNCTIASINEIRGYNMAAKVIPLVPNLNYVFVPGTNTITLLNLDNLFIESSYEFYIDYNTAQFSSLQGTYAPILNEFNTFFGDTYFPEYTITGLISARVDGDETPQLTYTLNQNGSITFDNIGTNDSHYIYISYVTSDTLFAVTSENQTGAIGVNSVSFGKGNSVSGGYSAAIGKGLTTIANSQMAIGRYNKCEPDSLFMVGNGDEPYNLGLCLILSNASNHPILKMDLSKVSDTIQGGSFYFTTSDQYKWFCEIPWYDPDDPIQDITNSAFRVDDSTIDFSMHEAVDSIDVIAIMLSQRMDEGEHNVYLNSNTNIVPATNTSTMIYATLAPLERNVFEVKTNGDVLINEALVGDFVIEQGTSGDWTYQKWNSGIVECWGYHTFSSATWAAYLSGGLYYTAPQVQKAFPFTIYNARPYVNVRSVGSNVGWAANVSCDDTGFGVTIVRNGNTGAIGLWVHVKGNWM